MVTAFSRPDTTLWVAARRYWRYFLPMWLFPVAFLFSIFLPNFENFLIAYFFFLIMPVGAFCFWVSATPFRRKQISFGQGLFWTSVVPFLVWVALIFGLFGLTFLLGAVNAS